MTRKLIVRMSAAGVAFLGVVVGLVLPASATTTIPLVLPQGPAFSILGYWCGGISEQVFGTGFDATSGFPTGDVHLSTTCNGSGRGGHSSTFTHWASATWDFTGALVTDAALSAAPTVNATGVFTDAHGNIVANAANKASLTWGPTFIPTPRLTSLSVTAGPTSGNTSVTITGTGLTGVTSVAFGTTPAASFTPNGDTSITAVSPSVSTPGPVDVIVTTPGGPNGTSSADTFTFYAQPVISGLSPSSGPLNQSTTITISGLNFTSASLVMLGDTPCGFFVDDDTTITAYAPLGEAVDTAAVSVTTIGGTSASTPNDVFSYTAPVVNTPGAPTIGSATGGDTTATVSFTPPTSDGGSAISSYTATAVDSTNAANGGQSASAASSPITVTGLIDGDSYTFTVSATNVNGTGPDSAPSNAVVPTAPPPPPPPGFSIATTTLPAALRGVAYSIQLLATGNTTPIKWKLVGTLPKGLKLHPTGLLSGTPRLADTAGAYQVTVQAITKKAKGTPSQTATQPLTLSLS